MNLKRAFVYLSCFVCLATLCTAQVAVLSPMPRQCFNDNLNSGKPLAGGLIYSCGAGTSCPGNPLATFTDSTGTRQNFNPVTLDSAGCASIWLSTGLAYKFVAQNASGVQEWSADNVTGLASTLTNSIASTTAIAFSSTPTFTSLAQNQLFTMTLTGNVTSSNLVMSGVTPPGLVSFEITQDGTGNRTFVWPVTTFGAVPVSSCANCTTTENFLWDGSTALLVSAYYNNSGVPFLAGTAGLFTNPGVFTNTQMNLSLQSLVNGCNPFTEYQAAQGANTTTEAVTGCVTVPGGSTVHQADGGGFYITNSSTSTNAVGVYSQARCLVNGTRCWGFNSVSRDVAGLTSNVTLYGGEIDVNPLNAPSAYSGVVGLQMELNTSAVAPGTYIGNGAFFVHSSTANARWQYGFQTGDDAASVGAQYGATCTSGSCSSQQIVFRSLNGGSGVTASFNSDSSGDIVATLPGGKAIITPGLQIQTDVSNDGGGLKHKRFGATCSTAASVGSFCTTTFSWTTAFADANYTPVCTPIGPTQVGIFSVASFNASGVTVEVVAATAASASFSGVNCIATHD